MADEISAVDAIYQAVRAQMEGSGESALDVSDATRAVAIVVWRRADAGVEIWLGQRAHTMRFMPGLWTFPGGLLADEDEDGARAVSGELGPGADRVEIAASIREVAEETGVRLPQEASRFHFAGRLVTPDVVPLRFDAALYLVELPAGEVADFRASEGEFRAGEWFTPEAALRGWRACQLALPEPTRHLVIALAEAAARGFDVGDAAERCQAAAVYANGRPRAYELFPGVWLSPVRTPTLPPAISTNCYIVGGRELVVIDPASPYRSEQEALDQALDDLCANGARVVEIWLTHHHGDHIAGARHLAERLGVPIAAHPKTAELLGSRMEVTRTLEDGDTRELAGDPPRRLRAIFTPGHAPGHLVFLEEETGCLMAGDMVAGLGTILVEPSEGDMRLYIESLRRLKALDARLLCPAHGPMIGDVAGKLDEYIEHRLWREERVVAALRERGPARPAELTSHAYADVPKAVHPLAQRSLIAHLIKLEYEQRAAREDDVWQLTPSGT